MRAVEVLVVTSDRGLCGAFNANVIKQAQAVVAQRSGVALTVSTAGRKGNEFFRRRGATLGADYPQQGWVSYGQAVQIASASRSATSPARSTKSCSSTASSCRR